MVTIKVLQNGPCLVQGDDVTVVDWNGVPYKAYREDSNKSGHSRLSAEKAVVRIGFLQR